jgi:hypothetical protein
VREDVTDIAAQEVREFAKRSKADPGTVVFILADDARSSPNDGGAFSSSESTTGTYFPQFVGEIGRVLYFVGTASATFVGSFVFHV